jgi:RNA polymerase sigma factor (sigma-70 family)
MDAAPTMVLMTKEQDRRISATVAAESARLRNFIRRRVADEADAEDILQEVFYEFVEAWRMMRPIEQAGAWLFRVARNRIIDRFRRQHREPMHDESSLDEDGQRMSLDELLPSADAGPEAAYARSMLITALEEALDELPEEQRQVFLAHEIEGRSFKELAAETGLSVNTLLGRKHYAVLHLRWRLRSIYDEFSGL